MARKAEFKYAKTPSGWKVEIPARLSPSGKRQRVFFPTRDEAKRFAAGARDDQDQHGAAAMIIPPSLADEAVRAKELLEPFGMTLLEAARVVVEMKRQQSASCVIDTALEQFLESKSGRSHVHAKAYGYMQRDLLTSFSGRLLVTITSSELYAHAERFARTPATFNALSRLVRAFWRWCAKHPRNWCDPKLVEILERKETSRNEIGVLDAAQCEALLKAAVEHYPECVPGFAVSMFTGMRQAELARITPEDITSTGINLPAQSTKTKRRRFIAMTDQLAAWLKAYPVAGTLLPANWHKKEKAVRRLAGWKVWSDLVNPSKPPANLPEWPHNALRHTHASVLVALGKPLESLIFEFGHTGGVQMLKSHYLGVLPKSEAEKIVQLRPYEV